jgi:hypothetical protein
MAFLEPAAWLAVSGLASALIFAVTRVIALAIVLRGTKPRERAELVRAVAVLFVRPTSNHDQKSDSTHDIRPGPADRGAARRTSRRPVRSPQPEYPQELGPSADDAVASTAVTGHKSTGPAVPGTHSPQ